MFMYLCHTSTFSWHYSFTNTNIAGQLQRLWIRIRNKAIKIKDEKKEIWKGRDMLYEYKQFDWGEASLKKFVCISLSYLGFIGEKLHSKQAQMVFMLEVKIIGFS